MVNNPKVGMVVYQADLDNLDENPDWGFDDLIDPHFLVQCLDTDEFFVVRRFASRRDKDDDFRTCHASNFDPERFFETPEEALADAIRFEREYGESSLKRAALAEKIAASHH